MKFKSDFITNSSSSSFIAWGVSLDKIVFPRELSLEIFETHLRETKKFVEKGSSRWLDEYKKIISEMESFETDDVKITYVNEHIEFDTKMRIAYKGEETPFSWEASEYCEGIGISPSTIISEYPETTFGGVKEFVAKKFQDVLGVKLDAKDIQFFEESWYNG